MREGALGGGRCLRQALVAASPLQDRLPSAGQHVHLQDRLPFAGQHVHLQGCRPFARLQAFCKAAGQLGNTMPCG